MEKQTYFEVKQETIRDEKKEAALRMLAFCLKALKLPHMAIKWFTPAPAKLPFGVPASVLSVFTKEKGLWGFVTSDDFEHIWIRGDLPIPETCATVAHEISHMSDYFTMPLEWYKNADHEGKAELLVDSIMADGLWQSDDEGFCDFLLGKDFSEGRFARTLEAQEEKKEKEPANAKKRQSSNSKYDPANMSESEFEAWMKWLNECSWREARAKQKLREMHRGTGQETGNFSL